MSPRWPVVLMLFVLCSCAQGNPLRNRPLLNRSNQRLAGQVLDFTNNHRGDQRIWSQALGQKRDLYVYLPPCFNPHQRYPLLFWLHGFAQDEVSFLRDVIPSLDAAIASGQLPPMIIAAPDGSIPGRACFFSVGSFYLNSDAGNFEDYLMCDVWDFVHRNFPIRPERDAHIIAGASMGGGAAFNKGIKFRDRFKVVVGIFPPLNLRWLDCNCRYFGNFDPDCIGERTDFTRYREVVGRFYGIFTIRLGSVVRPLYGRDPNILDRVRMDNPIEMLDIYQLKEGELSMFVAYGRKDEFNLDAQVEHFVYAAHQRGISVTSVLDPNGRHNRETALSFIPALSDWLRPQIAPFSPPLVVQRP